MGLLDNMIGTAAKFAFGAAKEIAKDGVVEVSRAVQRKTCQAAVHATGQGLEVIQNLSADDGEVTVMVHELGLSLIETGAEMVRAASDGTITHEEIEHLLQMLSAAATSLKAIPE